MNSWPCETARSFERISERTYKRDESPEPPFMKYADEFRDPEKASALLGAIGEILKSVPLPEDRPLHIMEVCGGHTHSIFRYGLQRMVPESMSSYTVQAARFAFYRWGVLMIA